MKIANSFGDVALTRPGRLRPVTTTGNTDGQPAAKPRQASRPGARIAKPAPAPGDFAARTAMYAFYAHGELMIVAEVEPLPEFLIDISQVPTDADPLFQLTLRPRPVTTALAEVQPPFRYSEVFSVDRAPEHILVRHATGYDEIAVDCTQDDLLDVLLGLTEGDVEVRLPDMTDEHDHGAPPARPSAPQPAEWHPQPRPGDRGASLVSDIVIRYRESVGYSNRLSFDEAFADALQKLPPPAVQFPDIMETVEVVHIGATFGGIAGFRRLEVHVRAYPE